MTSHQNYLPHREKKKSQESRPESDREQGKEVMCARAYVCVYLHIWSG